MCEPEEEEEEEEEERETDPKAYTRARQQSPF